MLTRREFLTVASATAAIIPFGPNFAKAAARQQVSEDQLLKFEPKGQVTLLHMTDCHAQLMPIYFREPSVNLGVGDVFGEPPHITGDAFLKYFNIEPRTPMAYALSSDGFKALALDYGKVGGMDRMARLVKAIRAERGAGKTLLLDSGDTIQGSCTSLKSKGGDMVRVMNQLGIEATTGHWEFTYGAERVTELYGNRVSEGACKAAFLAGNIVDTEWEEPVFQAFKMFERGGVQIAVIGQAFPFVPIANPRHLVPDWSFGIREKTVRSHVEAARQAGAELVVLLSHNGFDVDRKMAGRIDGIDVILTGHTHDALPAPVRVGRTLLIASGSSTKFLSRLDIEVKNGRMSDFRYALIPVLSDVIASDADMAKLIDEIRAPYQDMLTEVLGRTDGLLYRRGNFNGTFDDLICHALLQERDAEVAFSPGFRWGPSLLPNQDITWDDVYSQTSIPYPNCYRIKLTGAMIKNILEDVADNLFNLDPYYQQGGDMVRVGGLSFTVRVDGVMGRRIDELRLLRTGQLIDSEREYVVAGWASVSESVEGPPIWDVVANYIKRDKVLNLPENQSVNFVRGLRN